MHEILANLLPHSDSVFQWLELYGSGALFALLALGIIALPIPEETMLVFTGVLLKKGTLFIPNTLLAAYAGSCAGITVSYLIGKTWGYYLIHKYGRFLGITERKLTSAHNWFERYGKWSLLVGYFIPGVRHFTGISAGTTRLEFPTFAFFAYTGAILWVSLFLSIGYFSGAYWIQTLENAEFKIEWLLITALVLAALFLFFKFRKKSKS